MACVTAVTSADALEILNEARCRETNGSGFFIALNKFWKSRNANRRPVFRIRIYRL
jgi:predicted small secreted protein